MLIIIYSVPINTVFLIFYTKKVIFKSDIFHISKTIKILYGYFFTLHIINKIFL
nr:MAG TPA: hypothetical protein [Caudoviricetes sp.]